MSNHPAISVRNVSKKFKTVQAVKAVSFDIRQGEFVALLGPNGAGKTTLVEMIEGIQTPDSGSISIQGMNWKQHEATLRKKIGLCLQETRFIDKLTVRETLNVFAGFYQLPDSRIDEIINLINLGDKQKSYTQNLSGGQRQRLALGVALLNKPDILLLDEPTTGLDPKARRDIWVILEQLQTTGTAMILTTHYMEEAEYLCERIFMMFNGEILAEGTLDSLLNMHSHAEIIELSTLNPLTNGTMDSIPGIRSLESDDQGLNHRLEVDKITVTLPVLLNELENRQIEVTDLQCRKMTLDDLFISMTGQHLHE